jgi:hypothetical protein
MVTLHGKPVAKITPANTEHRNSLSEYDRFYPGPLFCREISRGAEMMAWT